jgi:hypothetical protein
LKPLFKLKTFLIKLKTTKKAMKKITSFNRDILKRYKQPILLLTLSLVVGLSLQAFAVEGTFTGSNTFVSNPQKIMKEIHFDKSPVPRWVFALNWYSGSLHKYTSWFLTETGNTYNAEQKSSLSLATSLKSCIVMSSTTPMFVCSEGLKLNSYNMNLSTGGMAVLGTHTYNVDLDSGTFIYDLDFSATYGAGGGTVMGIATLGGVSVFATFEVPPGVSGSTTNTPRSCVTVKNGATPGDVAAFVQTPSLSPTGIAVLLKAGSSNYVCYHSDLLAETALELDAEVCTSSISSNTFDYTMYWDGFKSEVKLYGTFNDGLVLNIVLPAGTLGTWKDFSGESKFPAEITTPASYSKQLVQIPNTEVWLMGINNYLYGFRES